MLNCEGGGGMWEEGVIVPGLVVVQTIYGSYTVAMSHFLSEGLNPLFLVACSNLTTFVFLFPFAVTLERRKWPRKLSPTLMLQFLFLAMGGVTAFQVLMMEGVKKTSPAIATAMPNLAPGLIFIITWCFRYEKVDLRCSHSRIKILGTLMCLTGAIAMSLLQTPTVSPNSMASHGPFLSSEPSVLPSSADWFIGCIYLLSGVCIISCSMVLQAVTMTEFPAPLTLCVVTSLIGAVLTVVVQLITEGKLEVGSPGLEVRRILCYVLLGGVAISLANAFQAWSMKKRGPVLVSMFNPINTVCAAILAALTLGQFLKLGSLAGMVFLFMGLYLVLWAKKKEGCSVLDDDDDDHNGVAEAGDIEKPLLR